MTELEKLNAVRERNGMFPLTELPKSAEEIEAQKIAAAEADKKRIEEEAAKKKAAENTPVEPVELEEQAVLDYLQKKKGLKVSSFDDLKPIRTQAEIDEEKQQRESEKLSWGLQNKKFKKEELENFFVESKTPQSLIFNSYAERLKAANPDLSDEQVHEQFKERYGLNKDPESFEYKQGQEELALMSTHILNKKYGTILSLEQEYSQYEQQQHQKSSLQAKIIANAPAYKKDIETVFTGLSTYKTKIGKEEFEIPIPQDFVERSKAYFLQDETAADNIQKGWSKEAIAEVANNMMLIENRDYINEKIAEQYYKNRLKGTRGVIPPRTGRPAETPIDEKLAKAAERHGATVPSPN